MHDDAADDDPPYTTTTDFYHETSTQISPPRLPTLWQDLLAPYSPPPESAARHLAGLTAAYSEPHRHHHTLAHLAHLLSWLTAFIVDDADTPALHLAAFYHDAVYDPRRADNEPASIALLDRAAADLRLPHDLTARAAALIDATRTHPITANPLAKVFLDADLAILGAPKLDYRAYAAHVRHEYAHVPDETYRPARAKILQNFLTRPRLYQTHLLHEALAPRARLNLEWEIRFLT